MKKLEKNPGENVFGGDVPLPPPRVLLSLTLGGRKIKDWTGWQKIAFVSYKSWGDKCINQQNNQHNFHIVVGMQPNYLGIYTPHPHQVCCYHWLHVREKSKRTELDDICAVQKLRKALLSPQTKMLEKHIPPPPIHPRFVTTAFRW